MTRTTRPRSTGKSVPPLRREVDVLAPEPTVPEVGVIALVPNAWKSAWTTRQQVLSRLARYFHVVWIDPSRDWREYWTPKGGRAFERTRLHSYRSGFTVLTPGCTLPRFYRPAWLRRRILARTLERARADLIRRGATRIVIYLWRDEFAEAIELVRHDASGYHIDDDYSFSERDVQNDPREVRLIEAVDQVIVHSRRLLEKKGGINPHTALIPNGVDYAIYSSPHKEPTDLAAIPRPRIGYSGILKKQLDLALLIRLARARPQWSFVLVGPLGNVSGKADALATLRALPNVHLLGYRSHERLAAYVQHMDVCLMCYEINDYTNSIYPLKLHEYLAAGRPTVASPIAEVAAHADVLEVAHDDEEWLAGITRALGPRATVSSEIERRRARARAFDWDGLVADIARLFYHRLGITLPADITADQAFVPGGSAWPSTGVAEATDRVA